MPPEPRTWEEVLAAVEADAEHSAALLAAPADEPLPLPAAPVLPALAAMPPVPEHLRERVLALRDRIRELQAELADALREWPVPTLPAPVTVTAAAPRYLDRRV
jgi:hypothetical protein